ncbi:putative WD repeat protein [Gregarina niphandrodes]|uniref:WD repeat protein n=1 Tax=Gregarina niphandrodes TaxID=110365 RepID=A0A023AXH6_GRENI|nr:putative WD repeat protein [Gregarina niphandrodes]EZG43168.1 putative WD repeat protein [Gregarina niphandrodes]|eukprot:XP_011133575.1 putative WD repeat protein [Gregarina niphandrodes]
MGASKRGLTEQENSPSKVGGGAPKKVVESEVADGSSSEGEDLTFQQEEVIASSDDETSVGDGEAPGDRSGEVLAGGSRAGGRETAEVVTRPFRPGVDVLEEDEVLEHDPSAYDMYHRINVEWPCLSFDIISHPKWAGSGSSAGPSASECASGSSSARYDVCFVAGTQAAVGCENALTVMACRNLYRTYESDSEDGFDDEDEEDEEKALRLETAFIRSKAAFNKVAVCPAAQQLAACLTDDGCVRVFDLSTHLRQLQDPTKIADSTQAPVYLNGRGVGGPGAGGLAIGQSVCHDAEGFALDWSPAGAEFVTGARDRRIVLHQPVPGGWSAARVFEGHTGSVEGLSFRSTGADTNCIASAGADGCVRVWDIRTPQATQVLTNWHNGDVNVVQFCPFEIGVPLLLSGGDDGWLKIADLRAPELPLFAIQYHREPICSVHWSDNTTFVAASYDNRATVWDLSAETVDAEHELEGVPSQLLFEHCGHQNLAAAKTHPLVPYLYISTGSDGFNLWRPEDLFKFTLQQ